MSELIDVIFYLFLLITPFFSGLYFEKNFTFASIVLLIILCLQLFCELKIKQKIKLSKENKLNKINEDFVLEKIENQNADKSKKIIRSICKIFLIIIVISNVTYFYNYLFLEENLDFKLISFGNVQIIEMFLFSIVCVLKNKSAKNKDELKLEYKIQNFVIILSSTIISLLMFFKEFYREGRFEGTFYYANSLAMFLIIVIVMIGESEFLKLKNKTLEKILKIFFLALNVTALILTNSRFTYVLLIIYFINKLINRIKKNNFKFKLKTIGFILTSSFILLIFGVIFFKIINSNEEISKRFQMDTIIWDIQLRVSYLSEANEIIKEYPLGLGYEGYLRHQKIKENKYRLRLVHNMPYQITLNYGICMLLFAGYNAFKYIIYVGRKYKNNRLSKSDKSNMKYINIILVLTFLHSLVDIGTSFLVIDNLLILLILRNFNY